MIERQAIVTLAVKGRYTSKPRPWVVVQSDDFKSTRSVIVCAFTHLLMPGIPMFRIDVAPSLANGLLVPSQLQADKIVTVDRTDAGREIGRLEDHYMRALDDALRGMLGL